MILPGHLAAAVLARRYLRVDPTVVVAASIAPDVIDKLCYYVLRISPHSRLPMHTLVGWVGSAVVVALLSWALGRRWAPDRRWRWVWAWCVGFGGHLLCDSPLAGGDMAFLFPFRAYNLTSSLPPFSYLWGLREWPWQMMITETLLFSATLYLEWRRNRTGWQSITLGGWWREFAKGE